jgi:hypothetical protein
MEDNKEQKKLPERLEGWEESERERENGGMLIVFALSSVLLMIAGVVGYILWNIK